MVTESAVHVRCPARLCEMGGLRHFAVWAGDGHGVQELVLASRKNFEVEQLSVA